MSGTALAINEQRFAPNIKNVISTEEFGNVAEGNMGEFLKFLPGLQISYDSGFASTVSIAGAPSDNVPITLDGFDVASSGSAGGSVSRAVDLTLVSVSNISRVEVAYTPTPDSRGSALAVSVNFVPLSSFERAHPILNYSLALLTRAGGPPVRMQDRRRYADARKTSTGCKASHSFRAASHMAMWRSPSHEPEFSPHAHERCQ